MSLKKLIHEPCGRMSYFDSVFSVNNKNEASGCAIIDADCVSLLADRMMEVAKGCDFATANKISTAMTSFIGSCHCGQRAYEYLYNIPATNFFQRVGSAFCESDMWRRDNPRAWEKFCRENGVEKYNETGA